MSDGAPAPSARRDGRPMAREEIARRLRAAASDLPVAQVLDGLCAALRDRGAAVLEATPGAGKTTLVPLALAADPAIDGRILMLEPRRLAARGAAAHMARLLGEDAPGGTVGFRVRGQSKVSAATRIEVVTEGILTRMLQSEPDLPGVGAVVFDEFHERSIHADLGLALTLDVQSALRPDLAVLVMSATLDGAQVARLLGDAEVIRATGRSHPVETRHLPRPRPAAARGGRRKVEVEVAELIGQALVAHEGGILAFLPGEREIRACAALLRPGLPGDVDLHELFGAMPLDRQGRALRPSPPGRRKLVLATAIAETSLTIPDIRVVVDGGMARRARFDPASGLTRLVTERVTRAEAEQRRGRAGRVAPGLCLRNWARAEEGALSPFPAPEIESADLAPLALELAVWGTPSGEGLRFLTPPPAPALAEARALLRDLGALDAGGGVTALGRRIAASPVHPRLGAMLAGGDPQAPVLAALLSDRDPLTGADRPADLALRVEAVRDPARFARQRGLPFDRAAAERIRAEARRLGWRPGATAGQKRGGADGGHSPGAATRGEAPGQAADDQGRTARAGHVGRALALAYPDRIGMRREGRAPRYLLSGGRGAELPAGDALGGDRFIVAAELDGRGADARIRLAAALDRADVEELFADRIELRTRCSWSRRDRRVEAVRERCLGALVLHAEPWRDCPAEDLAQALLAGVADLGVGCLNWTAAARRLQARIAWLRGRGAELPDCSDAALQEALEDWLLPAALEVASFDALRGRDLVPLLLARIGWEGQAMLDRLAPAHFTAPTGTRVPIDYASDPPAIAIRLQEMFGLTTHPTAGPDCLPLKVTLLSPAQRPLQTTTDLPGFWASSYADVRKDMRGRYPRHPWPEDPASATPTRRAKPRG